MNKLIVSNICTALLVAFFLRPGGTSHSLSEQSKSEDRARDRVIQKHNEEQSRSTASIKCSAKEFIKQRPNLEKYLIQDNSWQDQFTHFYTSLNPVEHQGESLHLTQILKPFYENFYNSLKEEFGDQAKEKMLSYFEFKRIYEDEINELKSINMYNHSTDITEAVTKYRRELIESGEYTSDDIENLITEFTQNERTKVKMGIAMERSKKLLSLEQEYRARLIKLFGENQLDNLDRLVRAKNDELKGTYGNRVYKSYRPDQKDQYGQVSPHEVENFETVELDEALVIISI